MQILPKVINSLSGWRVAGCSLSFPWQLITVRVIMRQHGWHPGGSLVYISWRRVFRTLKLWLSVQVESGITFISGNSWSWICRDKQEWGWLAWCAGDALTGCKLVLGRKARDKGKNPSCLSNDNFLIESPLFTRKVTGFPLTFAMIMGSQQIKLIELGLSYLFRSNRCNSFVKADSPIFSIKMYNSEEITNSPLRWALDDIISPGEACLFGGDQWTSVSKCRQ